MNETSGIEQHNVTAPVMIDARGLKCPLPVLKLERVLETTAPGQEIVVLATDPVARIDIALYCRQHGHTVEIAGQDNGVSRFDIVRDGQDASGQT